MLPAHSAAQLVLVQVLMALNAVTDALVAQPGQFWPMQVFTSPVVQYEYTHSNSPEQVAFARQVFMVEQHLAATHCPQGLVVSTTSVQVAPCKLVS